MNCLKRLLFLSILLSFSLFLQVQGAIAGCPAGSKSIPSCIVGKWTMDKEHHKNQMENMYTSMSPGMKAKVTSITGTSFFNVDKSGKSKYEQDMIMNISTWMAGKDSMKFDMEMTLKGETTHLICLQPDGKLLSTDRVGDIEVTTAAYVNGQKIDSPTQLPKDDNKPMSFDYECKDGSLFMRSDIKGADLILMKYDRR